MSGVAFRGRTGSPPRVRSRLPEVHTDLQPLGITSACAEQTAPVRVRPIAVQDHLRVCGADRSLIVV